MWHTVVTVALRRSCAAIADRATWALIDGACLSGPEHIAVASAKGVAMRIKNALVTVLGVRASTGVLTFFRARSNPLPASLSTPHVLALADPLTVLSRVLDTFVTIRCALPHTADTDWITVEPDED
jgi:hypothetical protein